MSIKEDILSIELEQDIFHNQDRKVSGIARRAVDNGWDSLSESQQAVLVPFLSHPCEGMIDPGGYHNECQQVLEDEELLNAYQNISFYDALLCQDCINEYEGYQHDLARLERE